MKMALSKIGEGGGDEAEHTNSFPLLRWIPRQNHSIARILLTIVSDPANFGDSVSICPRNKLLNKLTRQSKRPLSILIEHMSEKLLV